MLHLLPDRILYVSRLYAWFAHESIWPISSLITFQCPFCWSHLLSLFTYSINVSNQIGFKSHQMRPRGEKPGRLIELHGCCSWDDHFSKNCYCLTGSMADIFVLRLLWLESLCIQLSANAENFRQKLNGGPLPVIFELQVLKRKPVELDWSCSRVIWTELKMTLSLSYVSIIMLSEVCR